MTKTFHRPEAIRFLEQATWGPNDAEIGAVLGQGYLPWLAAQNAAAGRRPIRTPCTRSGRATRRTPATTRATRPTTRSIRIQNRFFTNALYGPDQLRQRVAWALHKIVVISEDALPYPFQMAPYLRVLDMNAFGNYRDILYQETLNPAMGEYLNMDTSTKYDPNENYAREIMQLFSIGTELLNQDGTTQNDGRTARCRPTTSRSSTSSSASTRVGTSTRCPARLPTAPTPATTGSTRCRSTRTYTTPTRRRSSRRSRTARSSCRPDQTGAQDLNADDRRDLQPSRTSARTSRASSSTAS